MHTNVNEMFLLLLNQISNSKYEWVAACAVRPLYHIQSCHHSDKTPSFLKVIKSHKQGCIVSGGLKEDTMSQSVIVLDSVTVSAHLIKKNGLSTYRRVFQSTRFVC